MTLQLINSRCVERESMKELFTAMAEVFPKIEGALKDSINPHLKNKYSSLSSVTMAIKPALAEHGLSYIQKSHRADGGTCCETIILHSSGQSISCGEYFSPAAKNDAQGYGSSFTYARRYSLSAAFGVCPEDDDGNAASQPPQRNQKSNEKISAEQVKELLDLIKKNERDLVNLCVYLKINSLHEMPAHEFDRIKAIVSKRAN
jgi:hypothetical protein